MLSWLHHLFNPHCEHCEKELQCPSCAMLRDLLENERAEKMQLLEMLHGSRTVQTPPAPEVDFKPVQVGRKVVPWNVRRQALEEQHRVAKDVMERNDREIADLEKELKIEVPANG